jgi:hypothetical protein
VVTIIEYQNRKKVTGITAKYQSFLLQIIINIILSENRGKRTDQPGIEPMVSYPKPKSLSTRPPKTP